MPFGDHIGIEWVWALPALSASAFIFILMFSKLLPKRGHFVSISSIFLGFILFWYVLQDLLASGPNSFSFNWLTIGDTQISWGAAVDRLSVTMLGLITFVAFLVQVYSLGYMRGEQRLNWYFALHCLFAASMLALVIADNLLFLYIAWELVGLGSYLLIGFWYERRPAAEAAKKAFVTTRLGDVGLLIGIILLFRATGTFEISTIFHIAEQGGIDNGILNISAFLIFLGAMGKSAQFPFHVWLPDAMEGPTPVSALIHAATMVAAGVYLVARMLPLFEMAPTVLLIVSCVGLLTFIIASSIALVMTDIKRILAYSTISHLGLMMLALGALGPASAIFHLIVHGFSKALLFLGAGSVIHSLDGKTDIREMGGLWRRMPITTLAFVIGAASLAGIIPMGGFFSKEEILITLLHNRNPFFLTLTLIAVALSALYMARVTFVVFFGSLKSENKHIHESPITMTIPLIILAFCALTTGLLVFDWSQAYQGFGSYLLHDQIFLAGYEQIHHELWLTSVSVALVVAGATFGWAVYLKGSVSRTIIAKRYSWIHQLLINKYYIDELYQWVITHVILAFSNFIALFDRVVINDIIVDKSALTLLISGLRLRYIQTGRIYNYGITMALGIVSLALIWWIASI